MDALTLLLFGYMMAMIILANFASRHDWARVLTWILSGTLVLLLLGGGTVIALPTLFPFRTRPGIEINLPVTATILLGVGSGVAACLVPWIRQQVARVLPIDVWNPVHTVGLQLFLVALAHGLFTLVAIDPLAAVASEPPETLIDVFLTEIPFVIFALLGVGFLIRRNPLQTLQRLGLVRPQLFHLALALVMAQLFLVFGFLMDAVSQALTPDLDRRINDVINHLYQPKSSALIYFAALSIMAGSGEEILFRGALQPRFGILLTALLFASGHGQYGISFALLQVFVGGLVFGWMRQRTNTTTTLVSHAVYDILTTLVPLTLGSLSEPSQGRATEILLALLVLQALLLLGWWVHRMDRRPGPDDDSQGWTPSPPTNLHQAEENQGTFPK